MAAGIIEADQFSGNVSLALNPTKSTAVKKGFRRSRRKWLIPLTRNLDFPLVTGNTFGLASASAN